LLLAAPSAPAPAATGIVVTTSSDTVNGDVRTVAALIGNPGPDGISLREALQATNNDPGSHAISFHRALIGTTITLGSPLPPLTGGGVAVAGDIAGDGKPDVTLRPAAHAAPPLPSAFQISSSGNRLQALTLEDFATGVLMQPYWPHWLPDRGELPSHRTFADNLVSGLVIRSGTGSGVGIGSVADPECNHLTSPCPTYNRWVNTAFIGNTIEVGKFAVAVGPSASVGDLIEGLTIADNTIRHGTSATPANGGAAVQIASGGSSTQTRISDVLIARNSIEGVNGDGGIFVGAGLQRAQANTIERLRIIDNRIHLVRQGSAPCCFAIVVEAGQDTWAVDVRPVNYPSRNLVRDVRVAGNSVNGDLAAGVKIAAGMDAGGSENHIEVCASSAT
jgi:hypothetical protein